MTDPYAALGLTKTASADDIKKAYRKIARTSHPDLNPDDPTAEAKFKAASAAYDLLKDPETRARFDRGEIDASGAERQQQRTYYRDYADQPSNPYRQGQSYEDFDPSDIFAEMLRGRGRGRSGQGQGSPGFSARGMDTHYSLGIPFLDAARGAVTRITLADGSNIEVKIPEGAEEGTTLRLRGKGEPGFGDGPPGDALITLGIQPHPVFRREGDDILITLPITLDEAVLGGKVEAPTIGGPVNLTIPKGASSGQTLRLRGRGIRGKGDQKVELKVVLPPKIDDVLAEFMEGWKAKNAYDPRKGMKT